MLTLGLPNINAANDPLNWYARMKFRQQGNIPYRDPAIRDYKAQDNKLDAVAKHSMMYGGDSRATLNLAKKDEGLHFEQIAEKPIRFNSVLSAEVRHADRQYDDDNSSVVSDTLSVDEPHDPQEYKDAKREAGKAKGILGKAAKLKSE